MTFRLFKKKGKCIYFEEQEIKKPPTLEDIIPIGNFCVEPKGSYPYKECPLLKNGICGLYKNTPFNNSKLCGVNITDTLEI